MTMISRWRTRRRASESPYPQGVARGGKAKTWHISEVNPYHVIPKLQDNIAITADLVCTDDANIYQRMPDNIQTHEIVNHSAKEWVRGEVHTATIGARVVVWVNTHPSLTSRVCAGWPSTLPARPSVSVFTTGTPVPSIAM